MKHKDYIRCENFESLRKQFSREELYSYLLFAASWSQVWMVYEIGRNESVSVRDRVGTDGIV